MKCKSFDHTVIFRFKEKIIYTIVYFINSSNRLLKGFTNVIVGLFTNMPCLKYKKMFLSKCLRKKISFSYHTLTQLSKAPPNYCGLEFLN
jgi:hypothetical protein